MSADADRRYLWIACWSSGGVRTASRSWWRSPPTPALLSDAGHMLSDVGAIVGALWAMSCRARPAAGRWTFGLKRAEILSAAVNRITLPSSAG